MNLNLRQALSINRFLGESTYHDCKHAHLPQSSAAEPIYDLDWTSTPDNQSILAVGFTHYVEFLCQQRKTYFDDDPRWAICWKIEIGKCVLSMHSTPCGHSQGLKFCAFPYQ